MPGRRNVRCCRREPKPKSNTPCRRSCSDRCGSDACPSPSARSCRESRSCRTSCSRRHLLELLYRFRYFRHELHGVGRDLLLVSLVGLDTDHLQLQMGREVGMPEGKVAPLPPSTEQLRLYLVDVL